MNERLRRLLVMLPWLQDRGTVSTRLMAEKFGLGVDELIADLTLASLCGVSEDPRDLIDLWVDEDEVHFGVPKYFDRPLRLTVPEAFSLIAAAEAARRITPSREVDDDALDRAIAKVAAAVGSATAALSVELSPPDTARELVTAASDGRVVVIGYWNVDTGEVRERSILPVEIFSERDHWYVRSLDVDIDAERIFRIDRIESVRTTDLVRGHDLGSRGEWFDGSADSVTVTLAYDPAYSWVLEGYPTVTGTKAPVESIVPEGWVVVNLVVTGRRWMQRVLLRLGPHGRVLQPSDWRDLSVETARSVLSRYETDRL